MAEERACGIHPFHTRGGTISSAYAAREKDGRRTSEPLAFFPPPLAFLAVMLNKYWWDELLANVVDLGRRLALLRRRRNGSAGSSVGRSPRLLLPAPPNDARGRRRIGGAYLDGRG